VCRLLAKNKVTTELKNANGEKNLATDGAWPFFREVGKIV
jgi:hypothetical protein